MLFRSPGCVVGQSADGRAGARFGGRGGAGFGPGALAAAGRSACTCAVVMPNNRAASPGCGVITEPGASAMTALDNRLSASASHTCGIFAWAAADNRLRPQGACPKRTRLHHLHHRHARAVEPPDERPLPKRTRLHNPHHQAISVKQTSATTAHSISSTNLGPH